MRNWSEALTGQLLVSGLLGRLLYSGPDRAWLDRLIEQDVFVDVPLGASQPDVDAALGLLHAWSSRNAGGLSDEEYDAVEADHSRLFVGPGQLGAAPWESVHGDGDRDRVLFTVATVSVHDWYARFGFVRASTFSEPEDHLGLELEFLARLADLSLKALAAEDDGRLQELLGAQRAFVDEHLLTWVPKWCRAVEQNARTDFYKGIGLLVSGVIDELAFVYDVDPATRRARGKHAGRVYGVAPSEGGVR